jgi:hypothetical protein
LETTLHHVADILGVHRSIGETLLVADSGPKKRAFFGLGVELGRRDIFIDPGHKIVPDGDLTRLPSLIHEAKRVLVTGVGKVPESESCHSAGPGGRIDECANDGTIAKPHDIVNLYGFQEMPGLLGRDFWGLSLENLVALGLGNQGGIEDHEVSFDEKIEKAPKCRHVLLLGR